MLMVVEAWMRQPGARVMGHRAVVRNATSTALPICECGYPFIPQPTLEGGCLAVSQHLVAAVRDGAVVVTDDDGLAGVREPRRPRSPLGSASAEVDGL
jgi:hypothetical protein